MPALCSMILMTNYAQNYACIKFACLKERGRMEEGGVRGRRREGRREEEGEGESGRKRGGGRGGGREGERERERGRRKVERKNPNGGDQ